MLHITKVLPQLSKRAFAHVYAAVLKRRRSLRHGRARKRQWNEHFV